MQPGPRPGRLGQPLLVARDGTGEDVVGERLGILHAEVPYQGEPQLPVQARARCKRSPATATRSGASGSSSGLATSSLRARFPMSEALSKLSSTRGSMPLRTRSAARTATSASVRAVPAVLGMWLKITGSDTARAYLLPQ